MKQLYQLILLLDTSKLIGDRMLKLCVWILLACVVGVRSLLSNDNFSPTLSEKCKSLFIAQGLSHQFNETVAHATHAMTVQALKLFRPIATVHNNIPTVNQDVASPVKVLAFAPDPFGSDFFTRPMNLADQILQVIGTPRDGLGPNWSPVERLLHSLHMWDLWEDIASLYHSTVVPYPPGQEFCNCLTDTGYNGIYKAVQWIADRYALGPHPELHDAETWSDRKNKLFPRYYTKTAIHDAALFFYCELKDL